MLRRDLRLVIALVHAVIGRPIECSQTTEVTMRLAAATAMTAVASHPTARLGPVMTNLRMMAAFEAISIIITITGAATRPLMTALQNSALIGSSGDRLMATPARVAITTVA